MLPFGCWKRTRCWDTSDSECNVDWWPPYTGGSNSQIKCSITSSKLINQLIKISVDVNIVSTQLNYIKKGSYTLILFHVFVADFFSPQIGPNRFLRVTEPCFNHIINQMMWHTNYSKCLMSLQFNRWLKLEHFQYLSYKRFQDPPTKFMVRAVRSQTWN